MLNIKLICLNVIFFFPPTKINAVMKTHDKIMCLLPDQIKATISVQFNT